MPLYGGIEGGLEEGEGASVCVNSPMGEPRPKALFY